MGKVGAAVQQHPNATVAFISTGPATLVVWLLGLFVSVPDEVAATIAGLVISAALLAGRYIRDSAGLVGRYGVVGCWRRLLYGPPEE